MISAKGVVKRFGDICAVDNVSADIRTGSVFGLIGSNGAGKSTFLRMMAGIIRPDSGSITYDNQEVFENIPLKKHIFYISDEQFFFANCTPEDMKKYYSTVYETFDGKRFDELLKKFGLEANRKVNTFSKGMKKQLSVICAIASMCDYILCDETFDGLDPVMRQAIKGMFAADVADRELTPVIASHNLRELEDICDHVGLLHRGGILFSRDLEDMRLSLSKVQCIFKDDMTQESFPGIDILTFEKRGSLYTITARGERSEILAHVSNMSPLFCEVLPLTLEEIFISETEVVGYDIKSLIV